LSVVDYFDALTSDRPYHKAMPQDDALALLRQEAGRALDPAIVRLFIDMLPGMRDRSQQLEAEPARRLSVQPASDRGVPAAGFQPERTPLLPPASSGTVFDDIAHAHREIYALYEIAQTMGTS